MTLGEARNLLAELQVGLVYLDEIGDLTSLEELRGEVETLTRDWPELERETRPLFTSLDTACL